MSEEPERSKTLQFTSIREYIVEFGSKKKIVSPLLVAKERLVGQIAAVGDVVTRFFAIKHLNSFRDKDDQ